MPPDPGPAPAPPPDLPGWVDGATGRWAVAAVRGSAAECHAASAALVAGRVSERQVVVRHVTGSAWVLGSTQRVETLRPEVRDGSGGGAGRAVVVRRSGGGIVPLGPDDQLWVDLVLPAADPYCADATRLAVAVGQWWRGALAAAGTGPSEVRVDAFGDALPAASTPDLGRVVCFAGLGRGEVEVRDRSGGWVKVVGIAQRRTRHGAVVQCVVPRTLDHAEVVDALDPSVLGADVVAAVRQALARAATTGLGAQVDLLLPALLAELARA